MIRLHRFRRLATMPVTCRLDDLAYPVDHQPGLLLVNLVAAVRVGDVLRVWHEPGELLLRLLLRIVGDVAEIRGDVCRQYTCGDHRRNLWPPGPVRGQDNQRHPPQSLSSTNLRKAAIRVVPLQSRVEGETLAYVAFHQPALYIPLLGRLGILKSLGQSVDEDQPGHFFWMNARIEPDNQAAIGVPGKHVGPGLASGFEERMKVSDRVLCGGRLRHRVAAARLLADRRSGRS